MFPFNQIVINICFRQKDFPTIAKLWWFFHMENVMEMHELRKTNQQLEKSRDEGKIWLKYKLNINFILWGRLWERYITHSRFSCLKACRGPTNSCSILVFLGQASTNSSVLLPFLGTFPRWKKPLKQSLLSLVGLYCHEQWGKSNTFSLIIQGKEKKIQDKPTCQKLLNKEIPWWSSG